MLTRVLEVLDGRRAVGQRGSPERREGFLGLYGPLSLLGDPPPPVSLGDVVTPPSANSALIVGTSPPGIATRSGCRPSRSGS